MIVQVEGVSVTTVPEEGLSFLLMKEGTVVGIFRATKMNITKKEKENAPKR